MSRSVPCFLSRDHSITSALECFMMQLITYPCSVTRRASGLLVQAVVVYHPRMSIGQMGQLRNTAVISLSEITAILSSQLTGIIVSPASARRTGSKSLGLRTSATDDVLRTAYAGDICTVSSLPRCFLFLTMFVALVERTRDCELSRWLSQEFKRLRTDWPVDDDGRCVN